ncbi:hypothetical protein R6Q57_010664 [Mikania cordata]
MVVTVYLVYKKRHDKKDCAERRSNFENFPRVSFRSLQKATNGFSHENLIGTGKFSSVYKAILSQKNEPLVVAVKVLKLAVHGAHKSFIAECEALKKIRHRNLVKIITACSGIDFQGNDFKALIYAYIANGSLEDWLHQNRVANSEIEEAASCLDFLQRLNIMIDVANALNFIHCESGSPMIHCDLKPSNVLLDADLVAYLGDFGLARFIQQTTHDSSISHTSNSLGIKGTIGYAAPEYAMGSNVSSYGDIYSFGILILEMLTGKRPTHDMFSNGLSLHEYAKTAMPDQIMDITDHALIETFHQDTMDRSQVHMPINECLKSVYQIGITCSMESPRDRGEMNNVFDQLQSVKKTFLQIRSNL